MRVILAGFNVESEILEETRARFGEAVTPEVLSASYARISRDPRSIAALRREARGSVENARRSNERIVFGLGHASVAEHAVLNFDLMGISRLAVEGIEHFRLASYTEKSQRYVRLGSDIVVPREVKEQGLEHEFRSLMRALERAYTDAYRLITASGAPSASAKEDARYLMPLAVATQLGMTVNARELEHMIRGLAASPLEELRRFSARAYRATKTLVPSLVRYPAPGAHALDAAAARREVASGVAGRHGRGARKGGDVRLVASTADADERLAASILFGSLGVSAAEARSRARSAGRRGRGSIIAATMRRMGPHDLPWREFETVGFLFELVVSASCFAQLKRHRIATIISQPYDPALGLTVPETFVRARAVGLLREAAASVQRFYRTHASSLGPAAEYALLNAHRRRVLFAANLRELYHFSRLRSDSSAQWEIRDVSGEMCRLASQASPAGAALLGGKDSFARGVRSGGEGDR
jgi:flavin-dependent thymidylate synthase